MYISNYRYRLADLNKINLEASAKLLADMFLNNNKIWATLAPTSEEVYNFMLAKTSEMLDWQQQLRDNGTIGKDTSLNLVYLDENDRVVAVCTGFELTQYLSKTSSVVLKQFDILQNYGKQLEKSIDPREKVPGLCLYGMFSAVDPKLVGSGLAILFWLDSAHYLHTQGFRVMYGRSSNVKSFSLLTKYGAQMTAKVKVVQNDKILTLSFVRWQFHPLFAKRQAIRRLIEKASL